MGDFYASLLEKTVEAVVGLTIAVLIASALGLLDVSVPLFDVAAN